MVYENKCDYNFRLNRLNFTTTKWKVEENYISNHAFKVSNK